LRARLRKRVVVVVGVVVSLVVAVVCYGEQEQVPEAKAGVWEKKTSVGCGWWRKTRGE
jgi:hypothetical protein